MSFTPFCSRGLTCILVGLVSMVIVAKATECEDTGKLCWWWSYMNWCKPTNSYSREKCPKRCDLCPTEPPMVTTQPSSNSSVPSVTPTVTPSPTQVTPSVTTPPHQKRPKRCELPELPFSHNMVDNMYIVGHILHAHDAVSEIHCEDFCLRAHNCLGFNFNVAGFSEKNCELLDHVKTYRSRPGFRFRLLDREYAYKSLLKPCC